MDARPALPPPAHIGFADDDAAPAQALAGLPGMLPGLPGAGRGVTGNTPAAAPAPAAVAPAAAAPKAPATETLAARTGALVNEVDFPGFVAQLVHGTFDAIVDASIRQMESYADLLSAVSKTVEQFTEENVSADQARDWLAQHYPADVSLQLPRGTDEVAAGPQVTPRAEGASPAWLSDYGLEGQELTTELLEQQVLPQVRLKVGGNRLQLLSTMVTLGINRVAVKDGSVSAKVMFRAAAKESNTVQYAQNPGDSGSTGGSNWGTRGNNAYAGVQTVVQTVNVNAQSSTELRADLFGEVKLNFVSETLPLDKLADPVKRGLIQRHAVLGSTPAAAPAAASAPATPATPPQGAR
ncbi:hypothetical protein HHL11_10655 [Ramlibacter sp. G-1-2-2]|uniref:Uncharacterized protein n=1 Tax=Ramlibacter agri TaxID=2728837 RepID=A0A848H3S9_9BURK|nr:hypothetical protein [Ramlibacter agri]NML44211.1 hypothetical protein [Ramlibacter agri]